MSESSRSESLESCTSETCTYHFPVVYRAHSSEELRGHEVHDVLKVADLARRSGTVICLPIFPVVCAMPQDNNHRFWTGVSALPMCQAEISAMPMCENGSTRQERVQFVLWGRPRLGPEWRKGEVAVGCGDTDGQKLLAELYSLVGLPFDESAINPILRPLYPKILWLVFHPVGPSAIEMVSLPHLQDVFDYDAFGTVPRRYCTLCARYIPEKIWQTPCAFHPGETRNDEWLCCDGHNENPGCMLERTHLTSEEVQWRGRQGWNCTP